LFVGVEDAPKPPPRRMSASPALLTMPDTTVVLLFFGEGKKSALKAFVAEEGSPQECPARLVKGVPDLWVFTDIGA
ncbi:MAG: 6-phosphogluconolactonase, partial [Spirochaetota bacterium]